MYDGRDWENDFSGVMFNPDWNRVPAPPTLAGYARRLPMERFE
jgi:hypothetical protein